MSADESTTVETAQPSGWTLAESAAYWQGSVQALIPGVSELTPEAKRDLVAFLAAVRAALTTESATADDSQEVRS